LEIDNRNYAELIRVVLNLPLIQMILFCWSLLEFVPNKNYFKTVAVTGKV
jgi:hypothetical protein